MTTPDWRLLRATTQQNADDLRRLDGGTFPCFNSADLNGLPSSERFV
jgi:hypothetical protein